MFILLGGCSRGQYSSRLARIQSRIVHGSPGRWPQAGRGNIKPAFIPLGSCSQTQYSSHLTTARKPGVCPAWRLPTSPVFIPLGGHSQTQRLSRLPVARKPSVYPAWRLSASSAFIPLGGYPRAQDLSRLAAAHEPSIYPAWRLPANPVFVPPGARQILNLVRKESLPPLAGDGAPMKKMLAFFSWVPGKVAAGRKG